MFTNRINLIHITSMGVTLISRFRYTCNSYIANKRGFVEMIPPSWGLSYQFDWHAINRSRHAINRSDELDKDDLS